MLIKDSVANGSVTAKATVTLELTGLGSWGPTYQMNQIIEQARTEAEGVIRNMARDAKKNVIVKSIKVTGIFTPED